MNARIYGHSEAGCKISVRPCDDAVNGTKTTNNGLVNKYDVMPAGRMEVDDVIHDMSLNLSLDHVTNRSNDQYGALRLPTSPSAIAANTEHPDSSRDPT